MKGFFTIDDAITMLEQFREESRLEGDTVLHVCKKDMEYMPVTGIFLDHDSDGACVCFQIGADNEDD